MNNAQQRLALLYLTKDRAQYTRATVGGLDDPRVDILWYDDSQEPEGRSVAQEATFQHARLLARKTSGVRGPARAIEAGLAELLAVSDAAWIGYYENDLLADDGWIDACLDAVAAAEADGWSVGAVSPQSRLANNYLIADRYGLAWTLGGVVLFRREFVPEILRTWRDFHTFRTMRRSFAAVGLYLSKNPEFQWHVNEAGLDAAIDSDWNIVTTALNVGRVTVVPVPSKGHDLDRTRSGIRAVEVGDRELQFHREAPAMVAREMVERWTYPLSRWDWAKRLITGAEFRRRREVPKGPRQSEP